MNWEELYESSIGVVNDVVRRPPNPEVLFHYTRPEAAVQIIEQGIIRASNIRYMNDLSELNYAHTVVADVLTTESKQLPESATFVVQSFIAALEKYTRTIDFYLASFSANPDLLGQWRAYCDGGRGFALGFKGSTFSKLGGELYLFRVTYDRAEQEDAIRRIFAIYKPALVSAASAGDQAALRVAARKLGLPIALLLLAFKHEAFRDEQEYRVFRSSIVPQPALDVHFRTTSTTIVPFIEVSMAAYSGNESGRAPLVEIVIGPCMNAELAEKSLRMLCEKQGHDPKIRRSSVPLASQGHT